MYARHLARLRGSLVQMLEIGLGTGAAQIAMWRSFFRELNYTALEINGTVAAAVPTGSAQSRVLVGDVGDSSFRSAVAEQLSALDFVLDDGSHRSADMVAAFEEFFPLVRPGGVYVVEDTMVDPAFLLFVHNLTVEMNSFSARRYGNFGWNCDDASVLAGKLGSIAFYDGILVVEKVDRSCYDAMPMNLP